MFGWSEEKSNTNLVERQRVIEEDVPSNQSDAEFKVTKHVVAASHSQENSTKNGINLQLCKMFDILKHWFYKRIIWTQRNLQKCPQATLYLRIRDSRSVSNDPVDRKIDQEGHHT